MLSSDRKQLLLRRWVPFLLAALLLLVVAPLVLSPFRLNLLGKFLTYAIIALGLDLIWGYGGMMSLGQGLFFGLGGYCMAMYMKLEAAKGSLPDFMSWSGRDTLPAFWEPFHSAAFAVPAAILAPFVLAGIIGFFIFNSRVKGVYFSIITQALTLIATILFIGQQPITGGTNGITDLTTLFGYSLVLDSAQKTLYTATVLCLGIAYLLCRSLTESRYGRLLIAMRDDENRVRFLGYNPVGLKMLAFSISAGLAGLAGALFVPQVGIISPSAMGVVPSVEMVIWVALGGRGTLAGAILGAILVNWGKSAFSENYPDIWQYFLGALFIGTVVLFPEGILGSARYWADKLRNRMRFVSTRKANVPSSDETAFHEPVIETID